MENSQTQKIGMISNAFAIITGIIVIGCAGYTFGKWVQSILH
ncbi:hypothetical protein [Flavobacterium noncentrifugens]|uniref:Uncharacterized protein n=1 Tax=Flavobacterium noncentrifugens TaxID=1128970 RepID=A0A1G8WRS3_9FLAO|nr:hypothetical protein [Flavobacterium noncentrifugens]SDJ80335.1 hypothetical protein SAMN04487935_1907 [Flavobacterium noncentrifugens]